MADDFSANTSTSGEVAVGGTASGHIETADDRDWFAVELVEGRTYTIELRGSPTDDGTLSDPCLYGIHDATGNRIADTVDDDGGHGLNSKVTFTATASGIFYIAAGAYGSNLGTYEVEVTDNSAADDVHTGATDFGDITALQGPRFPQGTLDGHTDQVDYYRFTLTEAKRVELGLRQQDANADLHLEDANGTVLYSSTNSGTANEAIGETLLAGTYYLRVESREAGTNEHVVRYGVAAPDADALAALQQQSGAAVNAAPTFAETSYAFDLAENADGSTNRMSLGTVAATDPEGTAPAYSLVGGNESGSFEVDETSGELFYKGSGEDFESGTTRFTLTVRASDGSETADTTVTVDVTDVNETPSFAETSYAFDLAENADGSTNRVSLGTVAATDPEGTAPAYSLVGGNESGSFDIDATSGELFYTGSGEDFESGTTRFELTVRASDGSETADTTVTVNVTDVDEAVEVDPTDADAARAGATNLGNITALQGPRFPLGTVDGDADQVDYYRFTLTEAKQVGLGLRQQDANADLFLEDANGNVLYRSTNSGTDNEVITETLLAGTYYLRVESQEAGENAHVVRYGVSAPDPDRVTALQQQSGTAVNEAPSFGQQGYTFALAENADGSTNRMSLGTVAATDPEGTAPAYSLVGGNESGSFEVDETSGELFYKGAGEDFESGTTRFELTVRASDGSETTDTTVTVNVTDVDEAVEVDPTDADAARAGATNLGNITALQGPRFPLGTVDGDADQVDYYRFTLTEAKQVGLGLRQQDANADLFLEDANGNVLYRSTNSGTDNEVITETLLAGTYYLRVESQAAGVNAHVVRYGVSAPDPDRVTALQEQSGTAVNEAPTFAETSYAFDLAENADGSTNRVSLGTVAATDPEGTAPAYSLAGGNESGSFEVDAASGELFYKGAGEDFESGTTRFTLTVRASDGSETADTTVTVDVTDVNEAVEVDPTATDENQSTLQTVSEPDGEDFSANTSTAGRIAVGDTATGEINFDQDWFAVELVAGRTYIIDLRGHSTGDGTLEGTYLRGVHDSGGTLRPGTTSAEGGEGLNSRVTFTPTESGTYYIAAGADYDQGTYELEVTEVQPTLRIANVQATEGDDSEMVFRVTLENPRSGTVTVNYATADGTATAGEDYTATSGTLTFAPGETVKTVAVAIIDDTVEDSGETFRLLLTEPSGARLGNSEATGTIFNSESGDDTSPLTPVSEPDGQDLPADTTTTGRVTVGADGSATGKIETHDDRDWFAVDLVAGTSYRIDVTGWFADAGTLPHPVVYGVYDADGNRAPGLWKTAISGQGASPREFFIPTTTGTYYLSAGAFWYVEQFGTYTVTVVEDSDDYAGDTSTTGTVAVGGSVRGKLDAPGDRDWIAVTLEAGKAYRIDLKGSSTGDGTLFNTAIHALHNSNGNLVAGGASSGGDGHNSRVAFTPQERGTYYVAVGAFGDSAIGCGFGGVEGTYTLSVQEADPDDYTADTATTGEVAVGGTAEGELQHWGDQDWLKVTLDAGIRYRIDLKGRDSDDGTLGNPRIGGIYDSDGNPVLETEAPAGDGDDRNSREFFTPDTAGIYYISAQAAAQRSIGTYTLCVTAPPTEDLPSLQVADTEANESDGTIVFRVTLDSASSQEVTVNYATADGTAKAILDYVAASGTLTFEPGTTEKLVAVTLINDAVEDAGETFTLVLSEPFGAELGDSEATGTIANTEGLAVSEPEGEDLPADTTTTVTVPVGGSGSGELDTTSDRDWFAVELEAGRLYRIDILGVTANAGTLIDPYLYGVYDANGNLLADTENDDFTDYTINAGVMLAPPATGTYYVAVGTDSSYRGGTYTLSVTDAGLPDDHSADTATTSTVAVGGSETGSIERTDDQDWFKVELEADTQYRVDLKGSPSGDGTLADPYLCGVYDAEGDYVSGTRDDDGGAGSNSRVTFTPEEDGTYYVAACASLSLTGTYTLSVAEDGM